MENARADDSVPVRHSDGPDPVGRWFGPPRDAYFVMPRRTIEAITMSWQRRSVALREDADATGKGGRSC